MSHTFGHIMDTQYTDSFKQRNCNFTDYFTQKICKSETDAERRVAEV